MVVYVQIHPLHLALCNERIFNRSNFRKALERKHTRVFQSKFYNLFFRQTYRSSRFCVHIDHLLCPLRDHITALLELEFKTAFTTNSLPINHPNSEFKNIVMTQWMHKSNFGLANDPEHIRVLAVFFTPTNCSSPIPRSLNKITQIIRRADRSAGIQFSPTYTERTSKDFGH